MNIAFVENEDSFSWNVIDILPFARKDIFILSGKELGRNPDIITKSKSIDALVIGPGPMDPQRVGLIQVIKQSAKMRMPLLGICLGHQALGLAFGSRLERVVPMHGKRSLIAFYKSRLFPGIIGEFMVMRYHSLSLNKIESPLKIVARSMEGAPMAIEHETLPMAGLQFHPDSYATEQGAMMVDSFFRAIR